MPKRVAEDGQGHEDASGNGVYRFIRDLIVEGKDARFVNKKGRYVINWSRALKCYHDYKSKRNPQYKSKNINRRKASNGLRAALLNFYKKEGAKEYKDCKKVNEKDEVIERQFQMPPRVFESLFGSDVQLSDDSSEHETSSIASEVDEKSLVTPNSSDTGFDEAMDIFDDLFNGNAEPSSQCSLGGLPTDDPLCDNVKTEQDHVDPSDITTPCQMFDISEEELDSALGEICSNSDNDIDLLGVVQDICPSSGSVKGGLQFYISLTEELSEDDKSGIAHFDGICDVHMEKLNPFTLVGTIPASQQPGSVPVTVNTQDGRLLGMTYFLYVDEILEVLKQLVNDPALQSLYFAMWSQQHGIFGSDGNILQNLGPFTLQDQGSSIQGTHTQALKVLQLLVYTAAQTNAQQFIQMIFSTSAGKLVFNACKDRPQLPEDVAMANGHDDLAQYLRDVNTRLSKESSSDTQPNAVDWLELVEAVNKIQKQSSVIEEETNLESGQSKDDDNQSDYFADAETSSCGSFELEIGWSDSEDGEGPCSKDGGSEKEPDEKSTPAMNVVPFEVPAEVETQLDNDVDRKDDENYEEPAIVNSKPTLNLSPGVFRQGRTRRKGEAVTSTQQGAYVNEAHKKRSFRQSTHGEKTGVGCLEWKDDDENNEEPSIVNSKQTAGYSLLGRRSKWRKRYAVTSTQQGACVKETHEMRPFGQEISQRGTGGGTQKRENTSETEQEARHRPVQEEYIQPKSSFSKDERLKKEPDEKPTPYLEGTPLEAPAGVGTHLNYDQDWKNDDKNYEEPTFVNSKPSWNLSNGYGLLGWLSRWRNRDATTSSQQGACVNETQEMQSFAQRSFQRVIGGGIQKKENTSVREQEARACPSQEKCTQPKRMRKWLKGDDATTSSQQGACENQTQEMQSFRLGIFQRVTGGGTQKWENTSDREQEARTGPSQGKTTKPKKRNQRRHWSSSGRAKFLLLTIALVTVLCLAAGIKLGERQLLHWAVGNGPIQISEVIMKFVSDVDAPNFHGETPLHMAAKNGYKDLAKLLMQLGSNVNAKNHEQQTPLHLAAWSGCQQIAEVLIHHGSNLKALDDSKQTAVHLAASNGHRNVLEVLVQHGSDVNDRNKWGFTPLYMAAVKGHLQVVQFLIQRGSDVKARDDNSELTALHLAAMNGYRQITEHLIQHGSDVNAGSKSGWTPLHLAVRKGHNNIAEVLIRYGSDCNVKNYHGQTPLHLAAWNGRQQVTEFLIRHGSDVHVRNKLGQTPLHLAARNGHRNIAEVLIRYGSDVNVRNKFGDTPLHLAVGSLLHLSAGSGHSQIVEVLIQHGSDVNARDRLQLTPLHLAAGNGHKSVAEVLIGYTSDVNARDMFGQTPLHLAEGGTLHLAALNARDRLQLMHLYLAAWNGRKNPIVEVLIRYGSDVNTRDIFGQTPLHLAAQRGFQEITEFLIQHGSEIKAQDDFQQTPLHFAARNGHRNVAEVLIRYGSDVRVRNKLGQTPLHLAAWNGHKEITEYLIQHGSELKAQDDFQQTALHLAAWSGHQELKEFLIRHGKGDSLEHRNAPVITWGTLLNHLESGGSLEDWLNEAIKDFHNHNDQAKIGKCIKNGTNKVLIPSEFPLKENAYEQHHLGDDVSCPIDHELKMENQSIDQCLSISLGRRDGGNAYLNPGLGISLPDRCQIIYNVQRQNPSVDSRRRLFMPASCTTKLPTIGKPKDRDGSGANGKPKDRDNNEANIGKCIKNGTNKVLIPSEFPLKENAYEQHHLVKVAELVRLITLVTLYIVLCIGLCYLTTRGKAIFHEGCQPPTNSSCDATVSKTKGSKIAGSSPSPVREGCEDGNFSKEKGEIRYLTKIQANYLQPQDSDATVSEAKESEIARSSSSPVR